MVGETIGSYRILKQLGAGAMGQVYLAEHRFLKRQAALKLLARELVDRPDLLERFFLEARATSAIAHPGIVQIFDCEIDASRKKRSSRSGRSTSSRASSLSAARRLRWRCSARNTWPMAPSPSCLRIR